MERPLLDETTGRPFNPPPLPPSNRIRGVTYSLDPGFHFDENQGVVVPGDEINFPERTVVVSNENAVTPARQELRGLFLATFSEDGPGVRRPLQPFQVVQQSSDDEPEVHAAFWPYQCGSADSTASPAGLFHAFARGPKSRWASE